VGVFVHATAGPEPFCGGDKDSPTSIDRVILELESLVSELEHGTVQVLGLVVIFFRDSAFAALDFFVLTTIPGEYFQVVRVEQVEAVPQADHRRQNGHVLTP
jgi:hypothetical protein